MSSQVVIEIAEYDRLRRAVTEAEHRADVQEGLKDKAIEEMVGLRHRTQEAERQAGSLRVALEESHAHNRRLIAEREEAIRRRDNHKQASEVNYNQYRQTYARLDVLRNERDRAIHERDQARRLADVRLGDIDHLNGELQRGSPSVQHLADRVAALEQKVTKANTWIGDTAELNRRLTALEGRVRPDPREPVLPRHQ